jgi:alcohol dehydrogenase
LLQVLAAGVNNTEINTRLGWYSSSVTTATEAFATAQDARPETKADGGWNAATPFPLIQGTDCCGRVVRAGSPHDQGLVGRRCLVRPCMRPHGFGVMENVWMASDFDGAFAQFVKVPASEVFPVNTDWSDVELATSPCAYGTAENMLHRAKVGAADKVFVTGASGGVGSAAVQLAKCRGATVVAATPADKVTQVKALGADAVVGRGATALEQLGEESIDVVVDNVAGEDFGRWLKLLRHGGRYVSSGAIAGPLVQFDMRDFYLKDLALIGCTARDEPVFPALISYIERKAIRPLVAAVFPLQDIAEAQRQFLKKAHVGKFVLVPPGCF